MARGDITFSNILPRGGSTREAFEELCFLLCASVYHHRGRMIRRNGSGGDGGLEAYLPTSIGAVELAIQAKRFEGKLSAPQWRQIDGSVRTALAENSIDAALTQYIVCTDCDFTETQQKKWEKYVSEWSIESKTLGYVSEIAFEHWGAAKMRAKLLQPAHHRLVVYFFDYPDLTLQRLWQVTRVTIDNLGERYLPKLHAITTCENELHWFVQSASALEQFHELVRDRLAPELQRPWRTKTDWSAQARPIAERANYHLGSVVRALGDGCSWPSSASELNFELSLFNEALHTLSALRREEQFRSPSNHDGNESVSEVYAAVRDETGFVQGIHLGGLLARIDCSCMLLLGDAGKGKSHLLAHFASDYVESGGAVVFLEGASFTSSDPPWKQFLSHIDFAGNVCEFLSAFSTMASSTSSVGLICIDAINETPDRNVWRNHLQTFAAEMRVFANLKLVVSCRQDYADLTLPLALVGAKCAAEWCRVSHNGLDIDINQAVGKYFTTYGVIGTPAQCFQEEFRTPLFLKLVCETFQKREIPIGTLSLTVVFREYLQQKAKLIEQRLDVRATQVESAIRQLAAEFVEHGRAALPEQEVRQVLLKFHSVTAESQSLYRALQSEGILHESRILTKDKSGYEIEARFAYERLWDHFVSLHFWPTDSDLPDAIRLNLMESQWRRRFQGVIRIFATRLPESGYGEIHDVAMLEPSRESEQLNSAFIDSLNWRHSDSINARTRHLLNAVARVGRQRMNDLILRWAMHTNHPWNAEYLHNRLSTQFSGLAARDLDWTLWLNEQLSTTGNEWFGEQLIVLAEKSNGMRLNAEQSLLLATTLAWMLATTHVSARQRISFALATLLRRQLAVAIQLVARFEAIDDPYVVVGIVFACAAISHVATPDDVHLSNLARSVHRVAFGQVERIPNLHLRFYAGNVCEAAMRMGCLPGDLDVDSFRSPFTSNWPTIQSESAFAEWESLVGADYSSYKTWSSVLRSTHPYDGDWGHYEMVPAVLAFQNRLLTESRASDHSKDSSFDHFEAQRYVIQRVLEMGLDAKQSDETGTFDSPSRDRPEVERLGKKYQWIALSEFLALLSDHYHPAIASEKPSIVHSDLTLVDAYDPGALLAPVKTTPPDAFLVSPTVPWWCQLQNPFTGRLSDLKRLQLCTETSIKSPCEMLGISDGTIDWIPLSFYFEFVEPRPNFLSGFDAGCRARMMWSIRSYIVPNAKTTLLKKLLCVEELDHRYNPSGGTIESGLELLPNYPNGCTYDEYATFDDVRSASAWLTTCGYVSGNDDRSVSGVIPSPQLARLSQLRWSGDGLSFCCDSDCNRVFESFENQSGDVAVYQRNQLLDLLKQSRHSLFWRVYVWKWIEGIGPQRKEPTSREYVGVFRMKNNGSSDFIWGSTWLQWPHALREALMW